MPGFGFNITSPLELEHHRALHKPSYPLPIAGFLETRNRTTLRQSVNLDGADRMGFPEWLGADCFVCHVLSFLCSSERGIEYER